MTIQQQYRMYAAKKMSMRVINLATGKIWKSIGANGHIMKGRGGLMATLDDSGRRMIESDEQYFFADLYSDDIGKRITVTFNPTLPSSGVELAFTKDAPYPAEQEFKLYVVVQFELPWLARLRYGSNVPRTFAMANRLEDPIRVKTTLSKEWGLEPGLVYALQDDEIPMWPWDWSNMNFFDQNPVTGGEAIPAAYVLKEGDKTQMLKTWRLEGESWVVRSA
jgi:hypothetical protein